MQNIDFYEGKSSRSRIPQFSVPEPEIYNNISTNNFKELDKNRKKASRMLFIVTALCIISFTAGIGIGIKFAGGAERQIIDRKTFNAVSGLKNRVTDMMQKKKSPREAVHNEKKVFPKAQYPYVIKLEKIFENDKTRSIANFLSRKGHTVILSRHNGSYRLYIGPYKSKSAANNSINKIASYSKYSLANNIRVIKR